MAATGEGALLTTEEKRFFRELAKASDSEQRDVVRFFLALGIRTYYERPPEPERRRRKKT